MIAWPISRILLPCLQSMAGYKFLSPSQWPRAQKSSNFRTKLGWTQAPVVTFYQSVSSGTRAATAWLSVTTHKFPVFVFGMDDGTVITYPANIRRRQQCMRVPGTRVPIIAHLLNVSATLSLDNQHNLVNLFNRRVDVNVEAPKSPVYCEQLLWIQYDLRVSIKTKGSSLKCVTLHLVTTSKIIMIRNKVKNQTRINEMCVERLSKGKGFFPT